MKNTDFKKCICSHSRDHQPPDMLLLYVTLVIFFTTLLALNFLITVKSERIVNKNMKSLWFILAFVIVFPVIYYWDERVAVSKCYLNYRRWCNDL